MAGGQTGANAFERILNWAYAHEPYVYVKRLASRIDERHNLRSRARGYSFTNAWVAGNLIASVVGSVAVFLLARTGHAGLLAALVISLWGLSRIGEILVTQAHIILVQAMRENGGGQVKSLQRSIICLIANCFEIMFWFACITMLLLVVIDGGFSQSWAHIVSSTIFGCMTFDSERVMELAATDDPSNWMRYVALAEALVGSAMSIVSISTFVGAIPGIRAKGDDEGDEGEKLGGDA